jgi:hypothetical protein
MKNLLFTLIISILSLSELNSTLYTFNSTDGIGFTGSGNVGVSTTTTVEGVFQDLTLKITQSGSNAYDGQYVNFNDNALYCGGDGIGSSPNTSRVLKVSKTDGSTFTLNSLIIIPICAQQETANLFVKAYSAGELVGTWTQNNVAKSTRITVDFSTVQDFSYIGIDKFEISSGVQDFYLDDLTINTVSVQNPNPFTASAYSPTQINLSWTKNANANNVLVAYNTSNTFGSPSGAYSAGNSISGGGTVLYVGNGTSFNHTGLSPNTKYYYKIWSDDGFNAYSEGVSDDETTPIDANSTVTASAVVVEPVDIPTTANSAAQSINVFDFTISDAGTSDGLPTFISQIALNTSGTANFGKVTWRLNGPDANNVIGEYSSGSNTLTFKNLNISVANAQNETYAVNAYYNDNSGITDNQNYILSMNGSSSANFTVTASGSQMASSQTAINNGGGSKTTVSATEISFSTQPSGSVSGAILTGQPVIKATDAFANVDLDYTANISISEDGDGAVSGASVKACVQGVATFTDIKYSATADKEHFHILANASGLTQIQSNDIISDVVATKLLFATQVAPLNIQSGVVTSFTSVPTIEAVDVDNKIDTDFNSNILLSVIDPNDGTLDGVVNNLSCSGDNDVSASTVTLAANLGSVTFSGLSLKYTNSGVQNTIALRATSGGLTPANGSNISSALYSTPTTQISSIHVLTGSTRANILFNRGNGSNYVVFLKQTNSGSQAPIDNVTYTGHDNWNTKGTQISSTGWYCIYNGADANPNVIITNLTRNTEYSVAAFEFNGDASNELYLKTIDAGNLTTFTTDDPEITLNTTGFVSNFGSQMINQYSSEASFSISGSELQGNITISAPSGFQISTTTGQAFNSVNPIIITPVSKSVNSTTIYVKFAPTEVAQYGPSDITINSKDINEKTISIQGVGANAPTLQASSIRFSNISRTGITVSWTKGDGEARALFVKNNKFSVSPLIDGAKYIANSQYTMGDMVDNGAYCVYNGSTENSVNITNLTKYKLYYFRMFEYNNANSPVYLQTITADNPASRWTLRKEDDSELHSGEFTIYPNPAYNIINLDIESDESNIETQIYSIDGNLIKTINNGIIAKGVQRLQLDISDLNTGIYVLKLLYGDEQIIGLFEVVK